MLKVQSRLQLHFPRLHHTHGMSSDPQQIKRLSSNVKRHTSIRYLLMLITTLYSGRLLLLTKPGT